MRIIADKISKNYQSGPLANISRGLLGIKESYALKDISFCVKSGECVGIIGANGSGKSTLLKILCNITAPSSGRYTVNGKISALLELGTSFNPEYTGISNIYLNGAINGLTKAETKKLIPKITEFAQIGDYINKPVKFYSDGMFLRLAFSCATAISPDILIIDEALAVGDFSFRIKCCKKIESMLKEGTAVILVSHNADLIKRFCTKTLWLDKGRLKYMGDTETACALYMQSITGNADTCIQLENLSHLDCVNRFGSAIGAIKKINFPSTIKTGEDINAVADIFIPDTIPLKHLAFSISVKNEYGKDLFVVSTADCGVSFSSHGQRQVVLSFPCLLCRGKYSLSVSLEDRASVPIRYYDYIEHIQSFCVFDEKDRFGLFCTNADCEIK